MGTDGYAKDVLVSTEWVADHLSDPGVVIAEVDENPALYDDGHIAGAIRLHWKDDLQDPIIRDVLAKGPFEQLLGSRGIGNATTVVLYGDKNNWFACYAYWYLKLYGHADARIMNGGRQKWIDEGRGLSHDVPSHTPTTYAAQERDESIRSHREQVLQIVEDGSEHLVDVRSPQEYSGELIAMPGYEQEGAQRAGHIPTARSIPWAKAVQDDGTFKAADDLRTLYGEQGIDTSKPTTAYCRIGERSAHTWFVLRELLGYQDVRNYDGSWTEWGSAIRAPIEK
jgi:thiosulfate/3-mercaptopyruvate sulfurtransferase